MNLKLNYNQSDMKHNDNNPYMDPNIIMQPCQNNQNNQTNPNQPRNNYYNNQLHSNIEYFNYLENKNKKQKKINKYNIIKTCHFFHGRGCYNQQCNFSHSIHPNSVYGLFLTMANNNSNVLLDLQQKFDKMNNNIILLTNKLNDKPIKQPVRHQTGIKQELNSIKQQQTKFNKLLSNINLKDIKQELDCIKQQQDKFHNLLTNSHNKNNINFLSKELSQNKREINVNSQLMRTIKAELQKLSKQQLLVTEKPDIHIISSLDLVKSKMDECLSQLSKNNYFSNQIKINKSLTSNAQDIINIKSTLKTLLSSQQNITKEIHELKENLSVHSAPDKNIKESLLSKFCLFEVQINKCLSDVKSYQLCTLETNRILSESKKEIINANKSLSVVINMKKSIISTLDNKFNAIKNLLHTACKKNNKNIELEPGIIPFLNIPPGRFKILETYSKERNINYGLTCLTYYRIRMKSYIITDIHNYFYTNLETDLKTYIKTYLKNNIERHPKK